MFLILGGIIGLTAIGVWLMPRQVTSPQAATMAH
jgi:hypothetical protein